MGKGKTIGGYVKKFVFANARKDDKTPRDELAAKLSKELGRLGHTPPAKSTLRKMISNARNREPGPQDQPWQYDTLKDYPMSPEGLAAVIEAYQFATLSNPNLTDAFHSKPAFTIRQAKWISRLSAVPKRLYPTYSDKDLIPLLIVFALDHAHTEEVSEMLGESFSGYECMNFMAFEDHLDGRENFTWEEHAVVALQDEATSGVRAEWGWARDPLNRREVAVLRELRSLNEREALEPGLTDDERHELERLIASKYEEHGKLKDQRHAREKGSKEEGK